MAADPPSDDRRGTPRLDGTLIAVTLRPRGRLGTVTAQAVDFNRYGIAVHTESPLDKDRVVYLNLQCGDVRLENLVGVVHNCVRRGSIFRSGIRFRPSSELQHDKPLVEALLPALEAAVKSRVGRGDGDARDREMARRGSPR